MSDITITDGLPEAWTLANTDKLKLDEANLINLAVGQLALLGASQGLVLREQTGVLKELIGSVDTVNDVLTSLGSGWSGETTNLGFPADAIGFSRFGDYHNLISGEDSTTTQSKMLTATTKMEQLGVQFGGYDAYSYRLTRNLNNPTEQVLALTRPPFKGTVSVTTNGPISLSNVTLDAEFRNIPLVSGQILILKLPDLIPGLPGGEAKYIYTSINSQPPALYRSTLTPGGIFVGDLSGLAIPSSSAELNNWELQAANSSNPGGLSSAQLSINNTASLTSTLQLAPRTNSAPAESNAVLLGIVDTSTVNYDSARYKAAGTNGAVAYQPYPPTVVPVFDSSVLIPANVGKVFQTKDLALNTTQIIYSDNFGNVKSAVVSETTKYIYNISSDELSKWRSQYAEKIIVITQRSSDQQLFVTNLAQKYQYAFDAATYVLKAFTTMLNSAANNI